MALAACAPPATDAAGPPVAIEGRPAAVVKGGFKLTPRRNFMGIYRPSTRTFFLQMQRPGWADVSESVTQFAYENMGDTPLIGDWNGDGLQTQGVWRAGGWLLSNTLGKTTADFVFSYGSVGDIPLVGDWDGNGTETPAVFRFGNTFLLRNANTTGNHDVTVTLGFAAAGDVPIAGDWNGDGIDTVGLYRPGSSTFLLVNQNVNRSSPDITTVFGTAGSGDKPIIGDWDEDGVSTVGIRRSFRFLVRNDNRAGSGDAHVLGGLGDASDIALAGNWNPNATQGFAAAPLASIFPIGVDFQPRCTFARWKQRGINLVVRVPDSQVTTPAGCPDPSWPESVQRWTTAAKDLGFKAIRAWETAADDTDQTMIAFHLGDEPDNGGSPSLPARKTEADAIRARTGRPLFINFNGIFVVRPTDKANDPEHCDGPGDYSNAPQSCYPGWLSTTDWVAQDSYPIADVSRFPEPGLHNIGVAVDKLRRWAPTKPQFTYIQAGADFPNSRQPTPGELRAQVWTAIIHGARGIIYFPLGNCLAQGCTIADDTDGGVRNPDGSDLAGGVAAQITAQNGRIQRHAGELLSQVNPPSVGFMVPPPLEVTWRFSARGCFFFVLNTSSVPQTATMTMKGLTPTMAIDVDEGARTVGAAGQPSFTDTFEGHGLHIYRVR